MSSSNLLSVPFLESRATSSSSSSSSSSMFGSGLQTSDSQTDYSPPHSPKKEALHFREPFIKSFLDHSTHLDRGLVTPKQSTRLLDTDRISTTEDLGYDSEHEYPSNNTTRHRPRLLTRKRIASNRYLATGDDPGIRTDSPRTQMIDIASPNMQSRLQDVSPELYPDAVESNKTIKTCVGLGLGVLPSDKATGSTDRPLVICTPISPDCHSPSATGTLSFQGPLPHTSPQKPQLRPLAMPDNMSPLESLPPLLSLTNVKNRFENTPYPGKSDTVPGSTLTEDITSGNKPASGLGLGLPSGFVARSGTQKTPFRCVETPLEAINEGRCQRKKLHSREYRYSKRRLYDICETSPSPCVLPPGKLNSISYPGASVVSILQTTQYASLFNNRRSSLPLVLGAGYIDGSTTLFLDLHSQQYRYGRSTRPLYLIQNNSFVWSPNSLIQPPTKSERPRSTYDEVAPWANPNAPRRQSFRSRSRHRPPPAPHVRSTFISPVLIHINMPKKLHFANHRHFRTEHTLF
ncbi:hypothetical protein BDZ94DRAFT_163914 [Collybia nuda]|uniref:Uncharacterized protein n=1 Tax=Collybia nuda TaxID=64659 RepID=A0A9P5XY81_9AGAR|nr:hypothetical protein BDZ94DRAFT_163914 [Collybia nuda]